MVQFYFHFPLTLKIIIYIKGTNYTFTFPCFTACRRTMVGSVMKWNRAINLRYNPFTHAGQE